MKQLLNQSAGFISLFVLIEVSWGQFESTFQEDESLLFEGQYNPLSEFILEPASSPYQSSETLSRPVIIVSDRDLTKQGGLGAKYRIESSESGDEEEDVEEVDEEKSIIVEPKRKKKKIDKPISAYVPTAFVISDQGDDKSMTRVIKQEPDDNEQEYGIMVVSPKQPESMNNYAMMNGANGDANEEVIDRNTIQLYNEPQIVEALQVNGQNQIRDLSGDDRDESLDAQKSKLTLLFLGYEKY